MYILPTDESICSGIYVFRCILVSCILGMSWLKVYPTYQNVFLQLRFPIIQLCTALYHLTICQHSNISNDCYGNYMVTKNDQIFSVTSFIVEKQLKRKFIDVFLDLMRHLLREIEITCNRGLSGFHWKQYLPQESIYLYF